MYIIELFLKLKEDFKKALVDTVKANQDYFNSIKGAEISDYTVVNEEVRITKFNNGVYVVVNYGDTDYESAYGIVKANGYITGKGA